MKKNILQESVCSEIITRINKLTSESKAEWGTMTVSQMLFHNYESFLIAYGEIIPRRKANAITKTLMRLMILKTNIPAPKGKAKTFVEIDEVLKNVHPDFEIVKADLINEIINFPKRNVHPTSVMLGKMSRKDWARLQYTHLDHHLLQFGV